MKDRRELGFCLQENRAVELIHGRWTGRERTTALAIYQAMTYLASVGWRNGGRDGFPATRGQIAEAAGSKPSTVDVYARELVQLGLLAIERRTSDRGHDMPSLWVLDSPRVAETEEAHPSRSGGTEESPRPSAGSAHEAPIASGVPEEAHRGSPSGAEGEPPTRARRTSVEEGRTEETPLAPQGETEGPDRDFDAWLVDHAEVTSCTPPKPGTKARTAVLAAYRARRAEDWTDEELRLATRGAMAHPYRRQNGYITAESVLRPTKIGDLVDRGRNGGRHQPQRESHRGGTDYDQVVQPA